MSASYNNRRQCVEAAMYHIKKMADQMTPEREKEIRKLECKSEGECQICEECLKIVTAREELLAEIGRLLEKLNFRNNTQVTGYCIRCEAIETKYAALEKERDELNAEISYWKRKSGYNK